MSVSDEVIGMKPSMLLQILDARGKTSESAQFLQKLTEIIG